MTINRNLILYNSIVKLMNKRNDNKGFTIIEVNIVGTSFVQYLQNILFYSSGHDKTLANANCVIPDIFIEYTFTCIPMRIN